ncbi:MAG: hypothetical protein GY705_01090 [Bacteroidetes bacterium]|nr:hypothetical protein [Bacteroidota bacterium]
MPIWLSVILEIIKITIPALIVFLTVYHLMKQYLNHQQQTKLLELKQSQQKTTLPLRLQAYERLSLLCERIAIPNLVFRLRKEGMTTQNLRIGMMLAIQQEFEHNITQQVYISEQLWQIIKIAREDTVDIINLVAENVDPNAPSGQYSSALFEYLNEKKMTVLDQALLAIKKEAAILM